MMHVMQRYVWRDRSYVATWITNAVDRVNEDKHPRLAKLGGFVVKVLGTGNYFG